MNTNFNDPVSAQDKPAAYFDPAANAWVYRMSAASGCSKAILLARTGQEGELPPEWMQQRFDDGHLHEPDILARVQRHIGIPVHDTDPSTGDQWRVEIEILPETPDHPRAILRGHLDGKAWPLTDEEDVRLIEAKAFAVSTWDKFMSSQFKTFPYYQTQLSLYLYAAGLDRCHYGIKNKNTGDVEVFDFTAEQIQVGDFTPNNIITRMRVIEGQARRGFVPESCDVKQYPCPFYRFHDEDQDAGSVDDLIASAFGGDTTDTDLDDDSEEAFNLLCAEYVQAREDAKEADNRKKELGRQIQERFLGDFRDSAATEFYKVTMKNHTHKWLDEGAMEDDGIDVEYYRREKHSKYPMVTDRRAKKRSRKK